MKMPCRVPRLKGYRFTREIVAYAVWAYHRFALSTADVEDLLAERGVTVTRILISGPDIRLAPSRFKALSMAFHELMTNARKYGALSASDGVIRIEWSLGGADGDEFELIWCEYGGPEVMIPDKTGFGTAMIEKSLAAEFGGQAEVTYRPEGLMFTLRGSIGSA